MDGIATQHDTFAPDLMASASHAPSVHHAPQARRDISAPLNSEHQDLLSRFTRDVEICSLLNRLLSHMDIQPIVAEVMQMEEGGEYDQLAVQEFEILSRELFNQLAALGVFLYPLPEGQASYDSLTAAQFVGMYQQIEAYRREIELGTYPMSGAAPLSVRPHPSWQLHNELNFRSVVHAEAPQYSVVNQSYTGSSMPFRGWFTKFFPDNQVVYRPRAEQAREFLHYLEQNILPDLRRAVAHYTALLRKNLIQPVSTTHRSRETMKLLDHMYYIHDRAVEILDNLGSLMEHGKDQLQANAPIIVDTMEEVRSQLAEFGALELEWAEQHGSHRHLPHPSPIKKMS